MQGVDDTLRSWLTYGDVDGVAGWRAEQLRRKSTFDPITTAVAALVKSLYVRQCELYTGLRQVCPLCDQWRGNSILVQVEVTEVVSQLYAAAETNGLPRWEHSVRWQQGEGGR